MIHKQALRAIISRTGCKLIARHNGRAFAVPAFANDIPVPFPLSLGAGGSESRGPSGHVLSGPALSNLLHGEQDAR
jgi:hypothetical protein